MPYRRIDDRRRASRESAARSRRAQAAEPEALPESPAPHGVGGSDDQAVGAIEGPAPPVDDGGFVALQHRCTTCGVVREVLIPSIDGIDVRELRGRCAQCERTPEAPDGPVLGPVDRGAVLRAPVGQEQRPPYVEQQPGARPSRADVMRELLAGSPVLVADQFGEMRPCAEVLAEDATRAALAPAPVDPRNVTYEPNRHGKIQSSAGREGQQGPVVVELPASGERAAVFVRRAPTSPARTVYLMPR